MKRLRYFLGCLLFLTAWAGCKGNKSQEIVSNVRHEVGHLHIGETPTQACDGALVAQSPHQPGIHHEAPAIPEPMPAPAPMPVPQPAPASPIQPGPRMPPPQPTPHPTPKALMPLPPLSHPPASKPAPRSPATEESTPGLHPSEVKPSPIPSGDSASETPQSLPAPTTPTITPKLGVRPRRKLDQVGHLLGPAVPKMTVVNKKQIELQFSIEDIGPSGLSSVELWSTHDCKDWEPVPSANTLNSLVTEVEGKGVNGLVIEVEEEGVYGFAMRARNGAGLGEAPPRFGELPQIWVLVDLEPPQAQFQQFQPRRSGNRFAAVITWEAHDTNLGAYPIQLAYAESATGPWVPIVAHLENTGRYLWQLSEKVPQAFYLQLRVTDRAGKSTTVRSREPFRLDTSIPTARISTATEPKEQPSPKPLDLTKAPQAEPYPPLPAQ